MGTNSTPLLADLFLHTFEYDFMLRTMKQDMNKAVQFSNTFCYIDDLFSVNNEHFGHYINAIYLLELELKDTTLTSNEVCYLQRSKLTFSKSRLLATFNCKMVATKKFSRQKKGRTLHDILHVAKNL